MSGLKHEIMKAVEIIAKHLPVEKPDNVQDVNTICAFTGRNIDRGIHKKQIIRSTFTDHGYLKYPSDYVSIDIAATMSNILPGKKGLVSLRNYSFIANQEQLILLKNNQVIPCLLNPLPAPFVFCLSFSNKKHLAFKSTINYSCLDHYYITTDLGRCLIILDIIKKYLPVVQRWYSIIPGKESTGTKPTWFTKQEITTGVISPGKIENYPGDFFNENALIDKYRGTLHFKIIIHFLTKS